MTDAAMNPSSGESVAEIGRLVLYWIVAFLVLVGAVALAWRADVLFGAIIVVWLILTVPLIRRTARWLEAQEHGEG